MKAAANSIHLPWSISRFSCLDPTTEIKALWWTTYFWSLSEMKTEEGLYFLPSLPRASAALLPLPALPTVQSIVHWVTSRFCPSTAWDHYTNPATTSLSFWRSPNRDKRACVSVLPPRQQHGEMSSPDRHTALSTAGSPRVALLLLEGSGQ